MVAIAEATEVAGAADLGTATPAQLKKAWDLVSQTANLPVEELARLIAGEAGVPVADFDTAGPLAHLVLPAEVAWRRRVVPLSCDERELVVATSDPLAREAAREVSLIAGREVRLRVAPPAAIEMALRSTYGKDPGGSSSPQPPERVKPGGPHILVVDDEAGARALFRSILEKAGFRVSVASDGQQAIDALSGRHDFDLVTLDYWMDKMNGLRVLQHVRSAGDTKRLPVIMVTGAGDRRIEMSLFEAGADDFIHKPIDAALFLLRIQAVIRRRQMR